MLKTEPAATSWFLWTRPPHGDPRELRADLEDVFRAAGLSPVEALVTRFPANVRRVGVKRAGALKRLFADPEIANVTVADVDDRVQIGFRIWSDRDRRDPDRVWHVEVYFSVPAECPTEAVLGFFEAAQRYFQVIHGGAAVFSSVWHARTEVGLVGFGGSNGSTTNKRTRFDSRHWREAQESLRRLYPVTIIGPEIWAKLPPLPALEHPPTVTDLGNCKLLTAWPTLCDPRDPAFLRGTVALREWLWPHTIQNPADHVDEDPYEYGQG